MEMVNGHGRNVLMGFPIQWIPLPSLKAEPHQNIATVVVCLFHAILPMGYDRGNYNKDASLSIHQKIFFIYFCAWPAMPYCHILIQLGSTATKWCSLVGR